MAKPLSISFNVKFEAAIKAAKERNVVLPESYYSDNQGIARQLSFSIAGVASVDQLQMVRDSLAKRTETGATFAEWKKEILASPEKLNLPDYRLENIYRTNLQGNYNRGKWQSFQEGKEDQPYLMYDAINDSRVRPTHLAMDGIIRPVDDHFWKTHFPPNGYQCRCSCIALNDRQAAARSQGNNGLNKPINSDDMQPDKGWDYNPGIDPVESISQSIDKRKTTVMPEFFNIMSESIAEQTLVNKAVTTAVQSTVIKNSITDGIAELEDYLMKLKNMAQTWFVLDEIKRVEELLAND